MNSFIIFPSKIVFHVYNGWLTICIVCYWAIKMCTRNDVQQECSRHKHYATISVCLTRKTFYSFRFISLCWNCTNIYTVHAYSYTKRASYIVYAMYRTIVGVLAKEELHTSKEKHVSLHLYIGNASLTFSLLLLTLFSNKINHCALKIIICPTVTLFTLEEFT